MRVFITVLAICISGIISKNVQANDLGSWDSDPYWTIFTAHARAEMMYRRFNNRFCAFPENKPGVFGARRNMRLSLDEAKDAIDELWPKRYDKTFNVYKSRDIQTVQRCSNVKAAEEAFSAALLAVDYVEFTLETLNRERRLLAK